MVQLSPDTRIDNWDGSSGYHYSDDVIYGFSHTHLNGTGIPDFCDILVMPSVDGPTAKSMVGKKPVDGYTSKFSHKNEKAEPGYYSVKLDRGDILAEMTTTPRVGLHRYTFPKSDNAAIYLDLRWRDEVLDSSLKIYTSLSAGTKRIEGYRRSKSWAKDQMVYFAAEFSKPIESIETFSDGSATSINFDQGYGFSSKSIISKFNFKTKDGEQVLMKVALSSVSAEGARKNLEAELNHWDFDRVRKEAQNSWNKELSKIEVKGGTPAQMTNFYTALYHTMIQPNIYQDVDGTYRGMDGKVRKLEAGKFKGQGSKVNRGVDNNFKRSATRSKQTQNSKPPTQNSSDAHYTVFSLWDTFRAAHPLYTIVDEKRTVEFINTFIRMYEQGGKLPVWELAGNEENTMIGYNAVSVIADAMAKGIEGFDYQKAYEASIHSAELDIEGLDSFRKRGYISMEDEQESVSRTLEYAYNSFCVAVIARHALAKKYGGTFVTGAFYSYDGNVPPASDPIAKQMDIHMARARYYKNIYDAETGFMRPKQNGNWISPFEPNDVTFHFTEANSWQYSFFVPHDIDGLIRLHGSKKQFASKLDGLFTADEKTIGRDQPDITGLIGQYAHGNEPSHHVAYLYNYADEPWKTQYYARKIMDEFYTPNPDGLIGNEDCGQMSAWYLLSSLGFYQVNPSVATYSIGTPIFPEAKINLENGKSVVIKRSGTGQFVKSLKINGKAHKSAEFSHILFKRGGVMSYEMSNDIVKNWFEPTEPKSVPGGYPVVPTISGQRVFEDKTTVTISSPESIAIHYTTDGSAPNKNSKRYSGAFEIDESKTIKAVSVSEKSTSLVAESVLNKMPHDWDVELKSTYNRQYTGGGPKALIDGLRGTTNFASGEWQGYQDQDFVAVIDLKKEQEISTLGAGFLQVARSWIWMPTKVEFETSLDGKTFTKAASIDIDFPEREMTHTIKDYKKSISPVNARYVRVKATNLGVIPDWHPGAGFQAFIFVDEIFID